MNYCCGSCKYCSYDESYVYPFKCLKDKSRHSKEEYEKRIRDSYRCKEFVFLQMSEAKKCLELGKRFAEGMSKGLGMEELKPCPFCGGEAEIHKYYPPFERRIKVTVRCTSCRCNSGEWGRTDKAVEAWNRRKKTWTEKR